MVQFLGLDHFTLTIKTLKLSEPFYDQILRALGFKKIFSVYGSVGWDHKSFSFFLVEADLPFQDQPFQEKSIGLHHFSFQVSSQKEVDSFYSFAQKHALKTLHEPRMINQFDQGSYYLALEDPDGIKVEVGCRVKT